MIEKHLLKKKYCFQQIVSHFVDTLHIIKPYLKVGKIFFLEIKSIFQKIWKPFVYNITIL